MKHLSIRHDDVHPFFKWPVIRTKLVLFFSILLLVIATLGAKNLYFKGDYQIFFDGTNKQLQAFEEIQTTFNKADNISIVVAPESGDIFQPEHLQLIQEMTEDAWQTPYSTRHF